MKNYWWILVVLPLITKGQNNLVPNGDFEIYSECPSTISQITLATPWYSATANGSPDYFNACCPPTPWGNPHMGVPENGAGTQSAHSNNAYGGIICFHLTQQNTREFLQVKLSDTIIKGIPYLISFWLSLADIKHYSISTMGAYISEEAINEGQINTFTLIPQIMNHPLIPLDDKENWMLITDTFISNIGGEQFITIGNFFDDEESDTIHLNTGDISGWQAYYYIDDVSVIPVDTTIGIEDYKNSKVKVYPNPAHESFIIEYTEPIVEGIVFEIFDVAGRRVKTQNISTNRTIIETTDLDAGMYHYRLRENEIDKYSGKQIIIR